MSICNPITYHYGGSGGYSRTDRHLKMNKSILFAHLKCETKLKTFSTTVKSRKRSNHNSYFLIAQFKKSFFVLSIQLIEWFKIVAADLHLPNIFATNFCELH